MVTPSGCDAGMTHQQIIVALGERGGCTRAIILKAGEKTRILFDGVRITHTE